MDIGLGFGLVIVLALGLGTGLVLEFPGFSVNIIRKYFLLATLQLCVNSQGPLKFTCPIFLSYFVHESEHYQGHLVSD